VFGNRNGRGEPTKIPYGIALSTAVVGQRNVPLELSRLGGSNLNALENLFWGILYRSNSSTVELAMGGGEIQIYHLPI